VNIKNDKCGISKEKMKKTIIFADRRQTMSCIDIGLNNSGGVPGDKRQKSNVVENKGVEGVHKKN
jgi:hypothetical protein